MPDAHCRDEIVNQLKEESRLAELAKWSDDYGVSLARAKTDKMPLLLIVEDGSNPDKRFVQTSAANALEDALLKPFVRVRIDVATATGAQFAGDLGSPKLPFEVNQGSPHGPEPERELLAILLGIQVPDPVEELVHQLMLNSLQRRQRVQVRPESICRECGPL